MVLQSLLTRFNEIHGIGGLVADIGHASAEFTGLHGSSRALFVATVSSIHNQGIVLVTRNNREASDFYTDLSHFLEADSLHLFPSRETLPYDDARPFRESMMKRMVTLHSIVRGEGGIVIVPVRSLLEFVIPRELYEGSIIRIARNDSVPPPTLLQRLVELGYERVDRVSVPGQFSARGDLVDVFANGADRPLRLEFFDDVVESIRSFSPLTQKSTDQADAVTIIPSCDSVVDEAAREKLRTAGRWPDDSEVSRADIAPAVLYDLPGTFTDFADSRYLYIFNSLAGCRETAEFFAAETRRIFEERRGERDMLQPDRVLRPLEDVLGDIGRRWVLSILTETGGNGGDGNENRVVTFDMRERQGYRGQIRRFKEDVENLLSGGYRVIVGAFYEGQTNRLRELLRELVEKWPKRLLLKTIDLNEGFIDRKARIAVVLDREIFNRKRRYRAHAAKPASEPIAEIVNIGLGDYIVHVEHGIGIYRGIERLTTGGVEKDFFKLEYREGDEIYIPVDQINLLQRYIGQEGRKPRIDRLGSSTWNKVKEHVKKSVRSLAKDLIELYSIRASLQGHSFSRDTEWQMEFESGFRYEETADQIRTIEEVKSDMESPIPMDRLICGDVGFGKTEVAMRAAFKAVMDGKQVAVLVPTTILAEQHFNTFSDRFAPFPVTIEMLSRFKTSAEQRQIVQNLKTGVIDIVIGTHRLVQRDVQLKDLGLVVIDEEQRFGVEHKERLKQLRKLVDVITMTATPIPRTLYMSMTRIRDMSVIETPPKERVPIETYVHEFDDAVVRQAVTREIERGGQVYYVHNRVRTIDEKTEQLRRLLPGVSMLAAHGQMDEHELEEIMQAFFEREFQVLVTTTIIESGLDIPNVNTIVIERADRFGLSQLYQLRGRVGRSTRKAYAYLFYPPGSILPEPAQKRLSVINDHTELGAGFSIAMKDMELRGTGNILGSQQHGEMLTVGFEMYVKLLDEAIRELKGADEVIDIEPVLEVSYRGYIPVDFIESERLRIELYKQLAGVRTIGELVDLEEEILDRFGAPPHALRELLSVVRLRVLCREVGIRHLKERPGEIQLTFEKSRVDIIGLIQKINRNKKMFNISPRDYNTLHVYRNFDDSNQRYRFLKELFDYEE